MNIKVFEQENCKILEEEVNEFLTLKNIELINMQYSSAALPPDSEQGWCTTLIHSVMIQYKCISTLSTPPPKGPSVRY